MRTRASAWASADSGGARHLVAVEVGVERSADKRVDLDGPCPRRESLESLNAEAVASGRPVQEDRCSLMTSSSTSQTEFFGASTMRLADLMFWAISVSTSRFIHERLEEPVRMLRARQGRFARTSSAASPITRRSVSFGHVEAPQAAAPSSWRRALQAVRDEAARRHRDPPRTSSPPNAWLSAEEFRSGTCSTRSSRSTRSS